MQSVQRQFGKIKKRSADDTQVAVLIADFHESEKLLVRILDSTKSWREAWTAILSHQYRLLTEFSGLYEPIVGSSEATSNRKGKETPEKLVVRTGALRNEYEDLQAELTQELNAMEQRMIEPALQAKESLAPMKKTIKKREDRKLDYERCQSRYDSCAKKAKRDDSSLIKAEMDLAKATEVYNAADETLKQCLPPLISTTFSLLPLFLAAHVEIQNTMLATYYTVLHNYAQQHDFPSPSPEMSQIIQTWEKSVHPVQVEIERFSCVAPQPRGKLRTSEDRRNGNSLGNGIGNLRRRSNGYSLPPPLQQLQQQQQQDEPPVLPPNKPKPPINSNNGPLTPSSTISDSSYTTAPASHPSPLPSIRTATSSTTSPAPMTFSPAGPNQDYFVRDRQAAAADYLAAAAAAKNRPPPPPPRPKSGNVLHYVTALYDFEGQSAGDLAFKEGDRILVLEKTDSTDDWWEGKLRGVKGSFPANYVE